MTLKQNNAPIYYSIVVNRLSKEKQELALERIVALTLLGKMWLLLLPNNKELTRRIQYCRVP